MRRTTNTLFRQFQRGFATKAYIFPEDPRIVHYKFTRDIGETDETLLNQIVAHTTQRHKNSFIVGVEPSYLLAKDEDGTYKKPIQSSDELFEEYMKTNNVFKPYPGHIFLTLLDSNGTPDKDIEISLRPKLGNYHLKDGKTVLHPAIYGENPMPASIFHSEHIRYDQEIKVMSNKIRGFVEGHFTIIPLECCKVDLDEIRRNTRGVFAVRLYHLCMSIYKNTDINAVKDIEVRNEILKLAAIAEKLQERHSKEIANSNSDDSVVAAMACTHAVVKAIFGDAHHFEITHGPDLDTQAVSTYLSMALTENNKFFNFAEEVGLLNFASTLVKDANTNSQAPNTPTLG